MVELLIFLFLFRETQDAGISSTEKNSAVGDEITAEGDAPQTRKSPAVTYANLT